MKISGLASNMPCVKGCDRTEYTTSTYMPTPCWIISVNIYSLFDISITILGSSTIVTCPLGEPLCILRAPFHILSFPVVQSQLSFLLLKALEQNTDATRFTFRHRPIPSLFIPVLDRRRWERTLVIHLER